MTWTDEDLALINRMPFRNQTTEWRRLTQADRALLDNLRYSTVITDRDRERLQALAHRLGAER